MKASELKIYRVLSRNGYLIKGHIITAGGGDPRSKMLEKGFQPDPGVGMLESVFCEGIVNPDDGVPVDQYIRELMGQVRCENRLIHRGAPDMKLCAANRNFILRKLGYLAKELKDEYDCEI